jgi:hypothetical protein
MKIFNRHLVCLIFSALTTSTFASEVAVTCRGNIETFDQKIVTAGVTYLLWQKVSGSKAEIRFAGRAFEADVALATDGKAWKGRWLRKMDGNTYFSYLPDEGGTLKFEFESDRWFSGNCRN